MKKRYLVVEIIFALSLVSCSLAPTYKTPPMKLPAHYKESGHWLKAKPNVEAFERGEWWKMYGDAKLNHLENQVESANQNLKAALARYDEARAAADVARAAFFPTVSAAANVTREQTSANVANRVGTPLYGDKAAALNLNYELDVFGRVRNMVAAARSVAHASADDVAVIDLGLHAELASDYFALRGDDASQRVLDETVIAYRKALYLTRQRYHGGAAPIEDVDQAETQYENAKTQAADIHLKRAQLEHAIAVLIGEAPAMFTLAPEIPKTNIVTIAPMLPSTLLERRPDIAEAEQFVQAANANIGVARAAFFPDFNLSSTIGYESASFSNLFRGPSLVWALGPAAFASLLNPGSLPLLTQTVFDGGRLMGLSAEAYARFNETAANYRETVLTAYQEVEDSLVAIHQLDHERLTQTSAASASDRALKQALFRYKGGLTTYLDVVVIQNIALQNELTLINVKTRRQIASVQLIKALGGGWRV